MRLTEASPSAVAEDVGDGLIVGPHRDPNVLLQHHSGRRRRPGTESDQIVGPTMRPIPDDQVGTFPEEVCGDGTPSTRVR